VAGTTAGATSPPPRRSASARSRSPTTCASFASLLCWEGHTMLEVAHQLGHRVDVCERHYARVFTDYDPAKRTSAEQAIWAAREKLEEAL
jgi:hypothetical protein